LTLGEPSPESPQDLAPMAATKDPHKAGKQGAEEPELDADGLAVQKYVSTVLLVLPPQGFGEQALRFVRSSLYNVHVGTRSVSPESEELIRGRLQDEFQVDGPLRGESLEPYSGLILAAPESDCDFLRDPDVLRLVREARAQDKLLSTWGPGALALARAGILKGVRVTGSREAAAEVRAAGARYTGRQVEVCG
jgi:hypothetical protein